MLGDRPHRAIDMVRREGPLGASRSVLRNGLGHLYLRQEHFWYGLELDGHPRRSLPEEVRLERVDEPLLERVTEVGQSAAEARARHADGCDVWMAFEGDELLFACYTFRRRAPVMAAPTGELELPPRTAVLEDSVTAPAARGRGIAPASWSEIADVLAADGFRTLITKVETSNVPSRKAVEKAGFRELAVMKHSRLGLRRRTRLYAYEAGLATELAWLLSIPGP